MRNNPDGKRAVEGAGPYNMIRRTPYELRIYR